ncbi:NIPSNAP family protein [Nguyenibacter sp. L1]|uniref:NIPSNAP family protein n=1 Tax=Nguyenibacter sp. L1 TaxID=3049350 RepID=UPI002B4617D3|nr:NIPSNAP family protein [Nguyenibacter sp. L1]WRH89137.1 NIPSNAP family protein [Nguyenibacter sp. L1]
MISEERKYRLVPGSMTQFVSLYKAEGYPIISRYATLVGCWTHESGVLNTISFIWSYDSFAERDRQRQLLAANPQWQDFNSRIIGFILFQESIFLKPVSLS